MSKRTMVILLIAAVAIIAAFLSYKNDMNETETFDEEPEMKVVKKPVKKVVSDEPINKTLTDESGTDETGNN